MQPRAIVLLEPSPDIGLTPPPATREGWAGASPPTLIELAHGDLIGRLPHCKLHLRDPRISEAHALLSLRGDTLRLLSLRGRLTVDGAAQSDIALAPGQRITFANAVTIEVLDVVLPEAVVAIEGDGVPLQMLLGTTSVIVGAGDVIDLRASALPDANGWCVFEPEDDVSDDDAANDHIVNDVGSEGDEGWWYVTPGTRQRLVPDVPFTVAPGRTLTPRLVPLLQAGATPTTMPLSGAALRLVARYQSVHVFRADTPEPFIVDGVGAQIISELIALGGPTPWEVVAREIWRDAAVLPLLRGRWDAQVSRLRARLRSAGIRPDLVRADRHGYVELVLNDGDTIVDEL